MRQPLKDLRCFGVAALVRMAWQRHESILFPHSGPFDLCTQNKRNMWARKLGIWGIFKHDISLQQITVFSSRPSRSKKFCPLDNIRLICSWTGSFEDVAVLSVGFTWVWCPADAILLTARLPRFVFSNSPFKKQNANSEFLQNFADFQKNNSEILLNPNTGNYWNMAWIGVLAALAPVVVVLVRKWRRKNKKQEMQMKVVHSFSFMLKFEWAYTDNPTTYLNQPVCRVFLSPLENCAQQSWILARQSPNCMCQIEMGI